MIFVLRLVHILSGAFWYGAVMFTARLLVPSLQAAGPSAGPVIAQLNQRRMPMVMVGAGLLNVLSGIWLIAMVSGGGNGDWMGSAMGRTFSIGGASAIVALILGAVVSAPAANRLGLIGAAAAKRGGPPTPEEAVEMGRLQKRINLAGVYIGILLTLAVAAMAVARYL